MSGDFRPGLPFRIRDTVINRNAGLSPHQSKGWVTYITETHVSVCIEMGNVRNDVLKVKCTHAIFQQNFSVNVFEPLNQEIIERKEYEKLFPPEATGQTQ